MSTRRMRTAALIAAALAGLGPAVSAQVTTKTPQPGFNLFTVDQDIEVGRQSAIEAERQLRLLNDRNVDAYLGRIVQRLAAQAPGAEYPYSIKAVNAAEINAFALPGGPMYVNRGLIESARSEAELAGVLAHEMAHVAMRHGTHQASKAYLTRSGLGILGGLVGRPSGGTAQLVNTVGGVGLNALFLKFSRSDEYEADQVGAQMMAKAGYDARAMASFFERLKAEQARNPSKLEQFFSSHPSPANRETRIRQQAASLGSGSTQVVGNFATLQADLRRLPGAGSQQLAITEDSVATPSYGQVAVQVDPPSPRFEQFSHPEGFFTIDHPENWQVYTTGLAVSIAPQGGAVSQPDGQQAMLYGVIVNHYAPFRTDTATAGASYRRGYVPFEDRTTRPTSLIEATNDLVTTLLASNRYLRSSGTARSEVVDGAPAYSLLLSGRSPVTGEDEQVRVYTRALADGHVIYVLGVSPRRDAGAFDVAFARMVRTLNVNENAAHRGRASGVR
jgi:Zn-dependent protease with chaperone function